MQRSLLLQQNKDKAKFRIYEVIVTATYLYELILSMVK